MKFSILLFLLVSLAVLHAEDFHESKTSKKRGSGTLPSVFLPEKKSCDLSSGPRNNLEKLGVFIDADGAKFFNSDVLAHVENYFRNANIPGPFVLHALKEDSPDRVKLENNNGVTHLYFYKSAARGLALLAARNASDDASAIYDWKSHTVTVETALESSNALYARLNNLLLDKKTIQARLESQLGIKIEEGNSPEAKWNREELLNLTKTLMDMPSETLTTILKQLKTIKKYPILMSTDKNGLLAAAQYNYVTGELRVAPESFAFNSKQRLGDTSGERSFMHELGHAFWYGMNNETLANGQSFKAAFREQSWTPEGKIKILDNATKVYNNFVSDYAQTNVEEDFAESFASYMYESKDYERQGDAPLDSPNSLLSKKKFMEDNVFSGTSFSYSVHEKMKTYLYNEKSDTEAPKWTGEINKLRCQPQELSEEKVPYQFFARERESLNVRMGLTGVDEPGSGLDYVRVTFNNINEDGSLGEQQCYGDADHQQIACVDKKTGKYNVDLKTNVPYEEGNYVPTSVTLTDKNGNTRDHHLSNKIEPIHLPGENKVLREFRYSQKLGESEEFDRYSDVARQQLFIKLGITEQTTAEEALGFTLDKVSLKKVDDKKIKMGSGEVLSGSTYEITFPKNLKKLPVIPFVNFTFKDDNAETASKGLVYQVSLDTSKNTIVEDGKTKVKIWIPDVYAASAPNLARIEYRFNADMESGKAYHGFSMEAGKDVVAPRLNLNGKEQRKLSSNVDDTHISYQLGGAKSDKPRIDISVPLSGSLLSTFKEESLNEERIATIRDPQGRTFSYVPKFRKTKDGKWFMDFSHDLRSANFLSGDYEIIGLESNEKLDLAEIPELRASGIDSNPISVDVFGFKKNYLERNSIRKIRITRDADGPRIIP
jgi:hypothetical protein